jgi:hypothetical protein
MPDVVVYRICENDAGNVLDGQLYMAFLYNLAPVVHEGKKTDQMIPAFLPVRFMGGSYGEARSKATAFWISETAKTAAKKEQGRKAGLARRKEAVNA